MNEVTKNINSNLTVKVVYPSTGLLHFVRDLKVRKDAKKKQLSSNN